MQRESLKKRYVGEIKKRLIEEFLIKNVNAVPKIVKVSVNMGVGEFIKNKDAITKLSNDLAQITGQRPSTRNARISVAGFGIRKGQPVGLLVTLRGDRAFNFIDRFVSTVLPRIRDFKGVPLKGFDKSGNYTIGMNEHTVFPEIDITKIVKPFGLEITIVIDAKKKEEAKKLLELLGLPFEK